MPLGFSSLANTILELPRQNMQQQRVGLEKQRTDIQQAAENRIASEWAAKEKVLDQPFSAFAHPYFLALDKEGQEQARQALIQGKYLDNDTTGMTTRRRVQPFFQDLLQTPELLKTYHESAAKKLIAEITKTEEAIAKAEAMQDRDKITTLSRYRDAMVGRLAIADKGVADAITRAHATTAGELGWKAVPGAPGSFYNEKGMTKYDPVIGARALQLEREKARATHDPKAFEMKASIGRKTATLAALLQKALGDRWGGIMKGITESLKGMYDAPELKYNALLPLLDDPDVRRYYGEGFRDRWYAMDREEQRLIYSGHLPLDAYQAAHGGIVEPYVNATETGIQEGLESNLVPPGGPTPAAPTQPPATPQTETKRAAPSVQPPLRKGTRQEIEQIWKEANGDVERAKQIARSRGIDPYAR